MKINKKKAKFLIETIKEWEKSGLINSKKADELREDIEIKSLDWERLAKYSFIISIACIIIALASVFMDEKLLNFIVSLLKAPAILKSLFFVLASFIIFKLALKRKSKYPKKVFSNDAIMFFGVITIAIAVYFFGRTINEDNFSWLVLLASVIYGVLGFVFSSKIVWFFHLITFGSWFGLITGYVSGWGAYFLGMNYPVRFTILGVFLIIFSYLLKNHLNKKSLFKLTIIFGNLYLFISLWILSIFGNDIYNNLGISVEIELFFWSILFGIVSLGYIALGLKIDNNIFRGFGLTFLFINLYTKYFEYFWSSMHKTIFFLLLAVSFWILGSKAEKIWNLKVIDDIKDSFIKK